MNAPSKVLFATLGSLGLTALLLTGPVWAMNPPDPPAQKVVVHLSHFTDDLHAGFMALKIANALQKQGAEVTMFLDLEGARLAHRHNNLAIRWGDSETTFGTYFDQFLKGGGKILVCPHCAKHASVGDDTVRAGVLIGTEDQIATAMLEADKVIDY
jgi:predicted peroxiredoxin